MKQKKEVIQRVYQGSGLENPRADRQMSIGGARNYVKNNRMLFDKLISKKA